MPSCWYLKADQARGYSIVCVWPSQTLMTPWLRRTSRPRAQVRVWSYHKLHQPITKLTCAVKLVVKEWDLRWTCDCMDCGVHCAPLKSKMVNTPNLLCYSHLNKRSMRSSRAFIYSTSQFCGLFQSRAGSSIPMKLSVAEPHCLKLIRAREMQFSDFGWNSKLVVKICRLLDFPLFRRLFTVEIA